MSVAIVGASGAIGRAAVRAFARIDPDVRAVVRRAEAADELRTHAAKVAVSDLADRDDEGVIAAVFGADSVCHLVGPLDAPGEEMYEGVHVGFSRQIVELADRAHVRRILFVSALGADPSSPNAFLRAKGCAEEVIRDSGLEHAIVRTAAVYGVRSVWLELLVAGAARHPPVVAGDPSRVVAPVLADDVAALLVAADDLEEAVRGTWALEGPDRVSAGDLVAALAEDDTPPVIVPAEPGPIADLLGRPVSPTAVEILTRSWSVDAPDAASGFDLVLTPLAVGIRLIAAAVRLER